MFILDFLDEPILTQPGWFAKLQCAVFAKLNFSKSGTEPGNPMLILDFFEEPILAQPGRFAKLQCAIFAKLNFSRSGAETPLLIRDFWETPTIFTQPVGLQNYSAQFLCTLIFQGWEKETDLLLRNKPLFCQHRFGLKGDWCSFFFVVT